jgi:hypothetical protein
MEPAFICCAVSRVFAPAVFSSLKAKGRDSLHEADVPDRVLVCTACGTCSIFTGKPPKLSMETQQLIHSNVNKSDGEDRKEGEQGRG